MTIRDCISNKYLLNYLNYTEHTEPPKIMHVWAALSGISACLGRRCYLEIGIGKMFPNLFVLLVGPPGTRKTTAVNNIKKLLQNNTTVRFAPKDTAGQRQGLITAMLKGSEINTDDVQFDIANAATDLDLEDAIGEIDLNINNADQHTLYACIAEFRTFLGQNNLDFTGFLLEMWDGEDYDYQLKNTSATLKNPLLNMLACTTTNDLALLLPPAAIGQGFMSRFILVYDSKKYKNIPLSEACFDKSYLADIKETIHTVANTMNGPIKMSKAAIELDKQLYNQKIDIEDSRFLYYMERRHIHLLKAACALATSSGRMTIEPEDLLQANKLLSYTEVFMPEALGEFGLSPLAQVKQKILDFIRHVYPKPVTNTILLYMVQKDIKAIDYASCLSELINANKIKKVRSKSGDAFIYNNTNQEAVELLMEDNQLNEEYQNEQRH